MSSGIMEVLEPGLLSTVQDLGRYGYQKFGVPVSGAMDIFALRVANALVGNNDDAACIEMTVLGPRVRFLGNTWFALTGGNLSPALDDEPIPMWESIQAPEGSVLSFQGPADGMRCYLAIAGGFDVPVIMGSRSTYLKSGFGGFDGRSLKSGDMVKTFETGEEAFVERQYPKEVAHPVYGHEHTVRVVMGPQADLFTDAGKATLLGSQYVVSGLSDRMGYRFEGAAIEHVKGPDIISDGTALGSVQIPGDGLPIVLLADRGITGGYTKIATVISVDISTLAQAMPGDSLSFEAVTVDEAHAAVADQERLLDIIRNGDETPHVSQVSISVDGQTFEITDESGDPVALSELTATPSKRWTHAAKATIDGQTFDFEVNVEQVE